VDRSGGAGHLWKESTGYNPQAARRLEEIDRKISNLLRALEDGFEGANNANQRLRELREEQEKLEGTGSVEVSPPVMDAKTLAAYLERFQHKFRSGMMEEKKQLIRYCVESVELDPEECRVAIK